MNDGRRVIGRRRLIAGAAGAGVAAELSAGRRARSRASPPRRGPAIERLGVQGPPAGNALAVAWPANPVSLDAQTEPSPAATAFACAVMSGLLRFRLDPDPQTSAEHILEPDLATSLETPDATYWVFHLRPDANFLNVPPVNGHTVESEDVRFSFSRAAAIAQSQGRAVPVTLDATTIETPDPQTVVLRLPRPYAPLPQLLASVPEGLIYPREALAGLYDPVKNMFGCGPFYLDSYIPFVDTVHDGLVALGRNPGYFEPGLPYLDGVRQAIVPSEENRVAQLTAGSLDVLRVGPSAAPAATASNPSAAVVQAIDDRNYAIFFPLRSRALSPFIDVRVRQAVSEAIDRDAIGQALYGGQYDLAFAVNRSMGPWALRFDDLNSRDQRAYTFDPNDASLLLEAAGYAYELQQLQAPLKLAYPAGVLGPEFEALAQMIAEMLSAVFGSVIPQPLDYVADYLGHSGYRYGNFAADTMLLGPIPPYQNVDRYFLDLYRFFADPQDTVRFQDPQLDAMIDQARTQIDPELIQPSYLDVQRYLAGRLYAVAGLPVGYTATLLQPWIQSYSVPPEAYSAGRAWRTAQLAS